MESETHETNPVDPHIKAIVEEALRQLGVKEATVERKRKYSPRSQRAKALEEQKAFITAEQDHLWKRIIRSHWKATFKIDSFEDFAQYEPASEAIVEMFEEKGDEGIRPDKLDFGKGFEQSRWNNVILMRIRDELLNDEEMEISPEYVMACLSNQLRRARKIWRKVQARYNSRSGRLETEEEMLTRVNDAAKARLAAAGSRSCRKRVSTFPQTVASG
ncbi:hypothetical protein C0991_012292 [Blastosporella zonata]|nr:hypothetical protein C0991_012292 [Blastosporella zonata]